MQDGILISEGKITYYGLNCADMTLVVKFITNDETKQHHAAPEDEDTTTLRKHAQLIGPIFTFCFFLYLA